MDMDLLEVKRVVQWRVGGTLATLRQRFGRACRDWALTGEGVVSLADLKALDWPGWRNRRSVSQGSACCRPSSLSRWVHAVPRLTTYFQAARATRATSRSQAG